MPRSIVVGNDRLHLAFDRQYTLRDIYYPRVGEENHLAGHKSRTGVWCDGRFAWLDDSAWDRNIVYAEDSLASDVTLVHRDWDLEVHFTDTVDVGRDIFFRHVTVTNRAHNPVEVRLFYHYDFHLYGTGVGDTAFLDPEVRGIVVYRDKRYFLLNVMAGNTSGVENWATGIRDFRGLEGTWRDAEDGHLEGNPIAQGSVDATVAMLLGRIAPGTTAGGYHWMAAGQDMRAVRELNRFVMERGPESFIKRTTDWWRAWARKDDVDCGDLGEATATAYRRSLLLIRSHIDGGGAVIASTDSDIIEYSRDTYTYCWPRDGAQAVIALGVARYGAVCRQFFLFCQSAYWPEDGYFLHKFTPGGSVGSTWHPWVAPDGSRQLAIQEDETGLVVRALWEYYQGVKNIEFLRGVYRPLVTAAADFLVSYRDPATGLCRPSYDLWEERWGVHAYTVAAVWAGLTAAARFADLFNETQLSARYNETADSLRKAALVHFWDPAAGHFARSVMPRPDGSPVRDSALDSSVLAFTLFGMVDPLHPHTVATAEAIRKRLWVNTPVGGLARYEGDRYQRIGSDGDGVPGNPWIITTLWLSQYYSLAARTTAELEPARDLIRWAEGHMSPAGILPEQLHPQTGEPISVSPLTWSHAEYALAVQKYSDALHRLTRPADRRPRPSGRPSE